LNRLVVIFLESAELRAKNRQDISMDFWRENVDRIIEFNDKPLLMGNGSVSHAQMETHVRDIYAAFDSKRKADEALVADLEDLQELQQLEQQIKTR
jgi:hypothetical protein